MTQSLLASELQCKFFRSEFAETDVYSHMQVQSTLDYYTGHSFNLDIPDYFVLTS